MARRLLALLAAVLLPALVLTAPAAQAALMPTRTTIVAAPANAAYGATQTVTVTVTRGDGRPYVGPVELQWATAASATWNTATVTTAADGTYRVSYPATANRTWRALVLTTTTYGGSVSSILQTTVTAPLRLTFTTPRTEVGRFMIVRGTSVHRPYTSVKFWRQSGTSWGLVATVPVTAEGTFSFSQKQPMGASNWKVTFDSPVSGEFNTPPPVTFTNHTWSYFKLADVRRSSQRYWYERTSVLDGVSYPDSPYAILQPSNDWWTATWDLGGGCLSVRTNVGVEDGYSSISKFTVVAWRTLGGASRAFADITRSATSSTATPWVLDVQGATALKLSMQDEGAWNGPKYRAVLGTPKVACWKKPPMQ